MKSLILAFLLIPSICFAGTLVKYDKSTGNIIQTNDGLKEIPSQEVLNNRFISSTTDVIFVEDSVDISKQRVSNKKLIDIPKKELDDKAKVIKDAKDKKEADKQSAINKLKSILTDNEIAAIIN